MFLSPRLNNLATFAHLSPFFLLCSLLKYLTANPSDHDISPYIFQYVSLKSVDIFSHNYSIVILPQRINIDFPKICFSGFLFVYSGVSQDRSPEAGPGSPLSPCLVAKVLPDDRCLQPGPRIPLPRVRGDFQPHMLPAWNSSETRN